MEAIDAIWQSGSLVITPSGKEAEVTDRAGSPVARSGDDGTLSDGAGNVLLRAPLLPQGRRPKPADAGISIADGKGEALGEARVVKHRIGPKARHVTLAISDPAGQEVARLEPRDKRGEELALVAGGADVATVSVEQVKTGFMRKSRVYRADLSGDPGSLGPLLIAALVRYDAIIEVVVAASMRD